MDILTNQDAQKLIDMDKKIFLDGKLVDSYCLEFPERIEARCIIKSLDKRCLFRLQISQKMERTKITFHFQEEQRIIGLLRIDYNGPPHHNPQNLNEYVPRWLARYQGQRIDKSHIHYYIQGYKPLSWACPLDDDRFPVKSIQNINDFYDALESVRSRLHLLTVFMGEGRLML